MALSLIRCLVPSGVSHPVHGGQDQVVLFILPQTRSITHIRRIGNRIHHLGYGSFWLLPSSIYKVEWVFSAAAGAENLARSTSKPVSFQLSKIVDFGSQIDAPIRATFSTAKPGGTRVSLPSMQTFRSKEFNLHC